MVLNYLFNGAINATLKVPKVNKRIEKIIGTSFVSL